MREQGSTGQESKVIRWVMILGLFCVTVLPAIGHAQAFCALRHPHRAQQMLFPTSTSLQTFSNQITSQHRSLVQKNLNFSIHQNELGLHTIYAVFREEKNLKEHLGFIHVRSEKGEWGLIEIAWALYPNMKIKDFIFQRCREIARDEVETSTFKSFIHNKSLIDLRIYLTQVGDRLAKPLPHLTIEGQSLGLRLLRSALKTISVTRIVWAEMTSNH